MVQFLLTAMRLIQNIENALDALDYYDDTRHVRGDLDEHTDTVIIMVGRALHDASMYLRDGTNAFQVRAGDALGD